eukprot:CAMPEP_0197629900 /NCGR_PEP_ID=MMETSP1338-20131121/7568_1 /TAXON_ID=43686 ORGANISM="Pelagodinium beii, Strain RCC1491" /NCGR_SAMPLE_ID=MMETSP1338 /ASSEMBLY_ACC=CAM_ASM_000754 /LENGTH=454 /DNA_ID=CAMNT_0043201011 /DNA_START=49 /DNA_END=1413 /DNA_ORIENTATION=-
MAEGLQGGFEHGYSFTYGDGMLEGGCITEQLYIDKLSGRFSWSRNIEGKEQAVGQGSAYLMSQVSSVRFTTRLGDPSREFLNVAERQELRRRGIQTFLNRTAPMLLPFAVMLCNVLTLALCCSIIMAYACWQMLPTDESKLYYDMSRGPDSEGIAAVAVMSILTALSCLLAGWWLGAFKCGVMKFETNSGVGSRLGDKVAARYSFQRTLNTAILSSFIAWCLLVLFLCPLSYALSYKTECASGGCIQDPDSLEHPTCGVGNCSCGIVADLSCISASGASDLSLCTNIKRPLCGASTTDEVSGMHVPILMMTIGTNAFTALLGCLWFLQVSAMFQAWIFKPDRSNVVMVQEVQYHRFAVSFRSKTEAKMVFTMSAEDDPHAIAAALMPRGSGYKTGGIADMNLYQAPEALQGDYVPGGMGHPRWTTGMIPDMDMGGTPAVFETEGDNAELEPQWC